MFLHLPKRTSLLARHPLPILFPRCHQRLCRRTIMAEALPPLSREDRDTYARMGTTMEWFHNNFRNTWKVLYGACSSGKRPANMTIKQFLNTGSEFAHHLTMHHTIGMPPFLPFATYCQLLMNLKRSNTFFPYWRRKCQHFRKNWSS